MSVQNISPSNYLVKQLIARNILALLCYSEPRREFQVLALEIIHINTDKPKTGVLSNRKNWCLTSIYGVCHRAISNRVDYLASMFIFIVVFILLYSIWLSWLNQIVRLALEIQTNQGLVSSQGEKEPYIGDSYLFSHLYIQSDTKLRLFIFAV
jgi:hypothetical protein